MIERLNLAHKGLIVVLLPLVFEVMFVGLLAFLLNQCDQQIDREMRSKDVLATANDLGRVMVNASGACAAFNLNHADRSRVRFEQCRREAHVIIDALKVLVNDKPDEFAAVSAVEKSVEDASKLINAPSIGNEATDMSTVLAHSSTGIATEYIATIERAMKELAVSESAAEKQSLAAEESTIRSIVMVLAGGLLMNIALTIWLSLFFSRNITDRLRHVALNAQAVAKSEALEPPLAGPDEIAMLDEAVYKTAIDLQVMQREKAGLVAVVSHELKSPLTAVSAVFSLLQRGAFGPLNADATSRAQFAESAVERLGNRIEDLIDIEKLEERKFQFILSDTDLADLVAKVITDSGEFAAECGIPTIVGAVADAVFMADKQRLTRAIVSIVGNAQSRSAPGNQVSLRAVQEERMIVIEVRDNGPVIEGVHLQSYFDRLQSPGLTRVCATSPAQQVRLAIADMIVRQHGGDIIIESSTAGGTVFRILLPVDAVDQS